MKYSKSGRLFIVATPIGHRDDLSTRARATLAGADAVIAEDTRRARVLLASHALTRPLLSLHEHNEAARLPALLQRLHEGQDLALISDAGTPLISDPGFRLVRAASEAGVRVVPIPGPSAPIAALSVVGLPTDRFVFEGFLPARAGARATRLHELRDETRTLVFFEAPHRLSDTLEAMVEAFGGDREAALARELTKRYETVRREALAVLREWVAGDSDQQRGECVIVVRGAAGDKTEVSTAARDVLAVLSAELPLRQACRLAAKITGCSANALYREAHRDD
jgi:16S rRNA (cytidine1402-2'-O)-methyltransferase